MINWNTKVIPPQNWLRGIVFSGVIFKKHIFWQANVNNMVNNMMSVRVKNEMLGLTSSGLPAPLSIVSKKPLEFLLSDNRPLFDPLDGSVTGCLYTSIWKKT